MPSMSTAVIKSSGGDILAEPLVSQAHINASITSWSDWLNSSWSEGCEAVKIVVIGDEDYREEEWLMCR